MGANELMFRVVGPLHRTERPYQVKEKSPAPLTGAQNHEINRHDVNQANGSRPL
jgi:hypothetical protein